MPTSLPPPIRMRVRVQEDVFLIPVPQRSVKSFKFEQYIKINPNLIGIVFFVVVVVFKFCLITSHCSASQWGQLLLCVVAVWAGSSALLPEMWPPASSLSAERRRSALPAGPATGRPAHKWRGEVTLRRARSDHTWTTDNLKDAEDCHDWFMKSDHESLRQMLSPLPS